VVIVGQLAPSEQVPLSSSAHLAVLVWDLGRDATLALDWLRSEASNVPVLALAADPASASQALVAGARAALLRDADGGEIAAAAQALSRGLVVLDAEVLTSLLPTRGLVPKAAEPLTGRELEVVQLLAQGLSNKAIGDRLQISEHTAKFHVNAIISKLGAQTRTEAAVRAIRLGLVLL
jgi:DNA-binding NarL/FixJ family response regulator